MKPGLTALIYPRASLEFFKRYESNEPFVVNGLKKTIAPLTRLPFLKSLDALLRSWPDQIQAHLPDIADEASSIDTSPRDARKLFDNGMGLMFDHAHKISPELSKWLEAIRRDIGLSALTYSRCLVYATPQGKGTAPHFDQNVNFILQIHGTKKWWIAPNRHVENPLTRHTMGLSVDPELQTYLQKPMPTRMPSGITPIVLKPGSLLFVPRGSWHSTEAESDALSLNFTYSAPTWLDLLTAALRSRLALSSEWRETANGVSNPDRVRREIAQQKFNSLLLELTEDLPNWTAADILSATEE
ncbi:MAG: cupin domain-containing protein [Bdellovibrionia bacterium]